MSAARNIRPRAITAARYMFHENAHHADLRSSDEVKKTLNNVHSSLISAGHNLHTRRVNEAHVPNTRIEEHRRYAHNQLGSTLVHAIWNGREGSVRVASGR